MNDNDELKYLLITSVWRKVNKWNGSSSRLIFCIIPSKYHWPLRIHSTISCDFFSQGDKIWWNDRTSPFPAAIQSKCSTFLHCLMQFIQEYWFAVLINYNFLSRSYGFWFSYKAVWNSCWTWSNKWRAIRGGNEEQRTLLWRTEQSLAIKWILLLIHGIIFCCSTKLLDMWSTKKKHPLTWLLWRHCSDELHYMSFFFFGRKMLLRFIWSSIYPLQIFFRTCFYIQISRYEKASASRSGSQQLLALFFYSNCRNSVGSFWVDPFRPYGKTDLFLFSFHDNAAIAWMFNKPYRFYSICFLKVCWC